MNTSEQQEALLKLIRILFNLNNDLQNNSSTTEENIKEFFTELKKAADNDFKVETELEYLSMDPLKNENQYSIISYRDTILSVATKLACPYVIGTLLDDYEFTSNNVEKAFISAAKQGNIRIIGVLLDHPCGINYYYSLNLINQLIGNSDTNDVQGLVNTEKYIQQELPYLSAIDTVRKRLRGVQEFMEKEVDGSVINDDARWKNAKELINQALFYLYLPKGVIERSENTQNINKDYLLQKRQVVCAVAGLITGIAIAYFTGATVFTVLIAAAVVGTLLGITASHCVSKHLEQIKVEPTVESTVELYY